MRQRMFTLLAGMALGMVLLSGGYAASTALTATVSNQPIYVDGQRVYLTAYHIGGNNFVKLRDIGQAVGFNVYWDGTVQIESDKPYTGVIPSSQTPVPTQLIPTVPTEASAQAAIKALRDTYPHGTAYPTPYRPNNPLSRPYTNCDHCAGWFGTTIPMAAMLWSWWTRRTNTSSSPRAAPTIRSAGVDSISSGGWRNSPAMPVGHGIPNLII